MINTKKSETITFPIQFDDVRYLDKDTAKKAIGGIKTRLSKATPQMVSVEQIAQIVMQGKSIQPGILRGGAKGENWVKQQIFGIDLDNEKKGSKPKRIAENPLTVDSILDRCKKHNLTPILIYKTLSSRPEWERFRVLFLCDRVITDSAERDRIQKSLMNVFPECDASCCNADRFFLGGLKYGVCFSSECTFNPEELPQIEDKTQDNKSKSGFTLDYNYKKGGGQRSPELQKLIDDFDFLSYIRKNFNCTENEFPDRFVISPCPICNHNDDFCYYKDTNSFFCYSSSANLCGNDGHKGGTIVDFLMLTQNLDRTTATNKFIFELCDVDKRKSHLDFVKNQFDEYRKIFETDIEKPKFEELTVSDFTEKSDIYKYCLCFDNLIDLEEYINNLRQRAKQLRIKADFESRLTPYYRQAKNQIAKMQKIKKDVERQEELQKMPIWTDGEHILDDEFCKDFLKKHSMKCINQKFYDVDGVIPDAEIQQQIYNIISPYILSKHADYVKRLFNALRIKAYAPQPENDYHYIHMKNGTLNIDGTFTAEKVICLNRLNVDYVPNCGKPEKFIKYIDDLLYPEDIPTLQEYIGYSCTTSTKAQQALFIIGKGGEGKSRLMIILRALLGGKNVSGVKITDIQPGSYLLESLDQNLLNIDDDLSANKIEETSLFKQLVTAETPVRLNPKFKAPYDAQIYCKFLTFGNNCFSALYDNSDGFFRRQIILKTKDKSPDRTDNAFLAEAIINEELPQIFLWAFEGLQRLVKNGFHLTVSDRARKNLEENRNESNNLREFLSIGNNSDNGYFVYDADADITSKEFYDVYNWWCNDNGYVAFKVKTFSSYLKENANALNIEFSTHIYNADKRRVRGFHGIRKTYKFPDYNVSGTHKT